MNIFDNKKKEVRYLKGNSYICSPIREVAQLVSACVWGAQGRWFESSLPDIKNPTEKFLPDSFVFVSVAIYLRISFRTLPAAISAPSPAPWITSGYGWYALRMMMAFSVPRMRKAGWLRGTLRTAIDAL